LLFGFIYPSRRNVIPRNVMDEFLRLFETEFEFDFCGGKVCNGTFLSRNQYVTDVELEGFKDGRLDGRCAMAAEQIRKWTTAAVREEQSRHVQ
jgi:hypothetical protein